MEQKGDGCDDPSAEAPQPARTGTPAEFTASLRALRLWSGLTYRQLEARAGARSDTLPTSTIATTLGRVTLPREQFVDAFTRACGLSDEDVREWREARRRIATTGPASATADSDDRPAAPPAGAPARIPRWRRAAGLLGAAGIGVVGTLGVTGLLHASPTPGTLPETAVAGLRMPAVGSWARIHPARTPEFCLTEGRDRSGRYATAVAAQRLCTKEALPQVFLEPLSGNAVQIQWHHPKHGIGCLTVLTDGPGRDLIEPRDGCADTDPAQQFRLELLGPAAAARFRIRPAVTGQCLGLRGQDTQDGAEVVHGRCSGAPDQDFLIALTPPPPPPSAADSTRPPR
ncbi:helix-turn-helix domain-containing protein [Streptomyces sp. NPDC088745]|uniref:helix-turn-helix domain-containing protein n=1 Tax=Streptomyces sp. NPDC088745 TaxID=3365884 RepID=UPI00382595DE